MPRQGAIEESRENDLALPTSWQEIAEHSTNIAIFESVIKEFTLVDTKNDDDKLPDQLLSVARDILYISWGIKSVRSHKEDFERLLRHATSLVVVFLESYMGIPGTMSLPSSLREVADRLVDTVQLIYKLMKRKSQKSLTKRILGGYFGVRDIGKIKKYQRNLGSVASGFESESNNIKINEVLLGILKNRAQRSIKDDDTEHLEESAESAGNKKRPTEQLSPKIVKNRASGAVPVRTLDDEAGNPLVQAGWERRVSEQNRPYHYVDHDTRTTTSSWHRPPEPNGTTRTNFGEKRERKGMRTRYQESDDVEEVPSRQGSRTNNAPQMKTMQRLISVSDDEEYDTEISIDYPQASKGRSKREKFISTPKQKVKPTPVSPQHSLSDFTLNNSVEEGISKQGSRTNNAVQTKAKTRVVSVSDDEELDKEIPIDDPQAPKWQSKRKKSVSTPKQKTKTKTRANPVSDDEEHDAEAPIDDPQGPQGQSKKKISVSIPRQKVKSTSDSFNNGVEEGTSRQGTSRQGCQTKNMVQSKTKKREMPEYDDEEYDTQEIYDQAPKWPQSKSKKKSVSTPVSPRSFTFNNDTGNQTNKNIGNIDNSIILDSYNDYSVDRRRKPTRKGFSFGNGSGNQTNQNIGNIHNSTIADSYNDGFGDLSEEPTSFTFGNGSGNMTNQDIGNVY